MKVRYYLRDKLTQELSQPFAVLECAMIFKTQYQEIYEVITKEDNNDERVL
jgi:hypothetical protein